MLRKTRSSHCRTSRTWTAPRSGQAAGSSSVLRARLCGRCGPSMKTTQAAASRCGAHAAALLGCPRAVSVSPHSAACPAASQWRCHRAQSTWHLLFGALPQLNGLAGSFSGICRLPHPGCRALPVQRCLIVQVFDHFCPWIGNSVGKGNRHLFIAFVCIMSVAILIGYVVTFSRIFQLGIFTLGSRSAARVPITPPMMWLIAWPICNIPLLFTLLGLAGSQMGQVCAPEAVCLATTGLDHASPLSGYRTTHRLFQDVVCDLKYVGCTDCERGLVFHDSAGGERAEWQLKHNELGARCLATWSSPGNLVISWQPGHLLR